MPVKLTNEELRVLGVLMEKALTHPGSYPLTINAVRIGANQKQNREPVVEYTDGQVSKAIWSLQLKQLVEQAPPSAGARANKFAHRASEALEWGQRERAIMAELILRGRQTAGELRTRASRMIAFDDLDVANAVLNELKNTDPPTVEELPREPGRSTNRFRHLLAADDQADTTETGEAPVVEEPRRHGEDPQEPGMPTSADSAELPARVAALEARVDELARRVDALQTNREPVDTEGPSPV